MNLNSLIKPLKNIFIGKTNRHDFLLFHIVFFIGIMFFFILTIGFVPNILIIVAVIISFILQIRRMNDIGKKWLVFIKTLLELHYINFVMLFNN